MDLNAGSLNHSTALVPVCVLWRKHVLNSVYYDIVFSMLMFIHIIYLLQYGIESYPTTMLFNGSIVTEYNGQHNSHGIKQFVQVLCCT